MLGRSARAGLVALPMFLGFAEMASASTAVGHTTIDAGAKPFFVVGGIASTAACVAVAAALLVRGLRTLRRGRASRDWPSTTGEIISSEVSEGQSYNDGAYTYYTPKIHYTYAIDGVSYSSRTVQAGMAGFHYLGQLAASAIVARYPVGSTSTVRYDPANPAVSTLEIGQIGGLKQVVPGAIMLVLAVGAAVFMIWSIVTPSE